MTDKHEWANLIIRGAREDGSIAIIDAINKVTASGIANRGSVMVACAQIMAQTIVDAGSENADVIRAAIMTLIDDYAIRLAMEEPT